MRTISNAAVCTQFFGMPRRRHARFASAMLAIAVGTLVVTATAGCNWTERSYQRARSQRNEEALRRFIDEYPDSPLVASARADLTDLMEWSKAQGASPALGKYLESHPLGLFAPDAREAIAFAEAQTADVVSAYEAFLTKHPAGSRQKDAQARIEKLKPVEAAYRQVEDSSDLTALTDFIEKYSPAGYAKSVEGRLRGLATAQAETAILGQGAYRGVPTQLAALESYLRDNAPGQPRRLAEEAHIRVLLERMRIMRRAPFHVAAVQPSDETPLAETISLRDAGNVKTSGSFTGSGFSLTLRGLYVSRDGSMAQSITWGTGSLIVGEPQDLMDNFAGSLTVSQRNPKQYVIVTYLPQDRILVAGMYAAMFGRASSSAVLPAGDGSIYRFIGAVNDFFPDVHISSSENSPLYFGLLSDLGLVYLSGEGTIQVGDGAVVVLPVEN